MSYVRSFYQWHFVLSCSKQFESGEAEKEIQISVWISLKRSKEIFLIKILLLAYDLVTSVFCCLLENKLFVSFIEECFN